MKRTGIQAERFMEIQRRILTGECPSCSGLAQDFEVSERTIKRDIVFMRDRLGFPIEYSREKKGYYFTEAFSGIPVLYLQKEEILALLLARHSLEQYRDLPLGKSLNRLLETILDQAGGLPGFSAETIFEKFSFIPPPAVPVQYSFWNQLCGCMMQNQTVDITYQSVSKETPQTYRMNPLHIANIEGEWYLFARSHQKSDVLQLAISRIQAIQETGETFCEKKKFTSADLKKILFGRYASMQGKSETVRVRISAEGAARFQLKQWHADQKIIRRKDGSIEISFPVSSGSSKQPYANVISWILSMGRHAEVLAPGELKKIVKEETEQMLKM